MYPGWSLVSRRCIITCFIESPLCHVDHPISTEWSPSRSTIFLIGMDLKNTMTVRGNLTGQFFIQKRTSTDTLRRKFERYGEIGDAYIPRDRNTGGKHSVIQILLLKSRSLIGLDFFSTRAPMSQIQFETPTKSLGWELYFRIAWVRICPIQW